jgi:hypothetical protein
MRSPRMTQRKVKTMTTDELIARFVDYALAQDKTMYDSPRRCNAILPKMEVVEDELRRRSAYERLQTLFSHENMTVRLESARRLMTIMPEEARPVFEQIQKSRRGPWAGHAAAQLGYLDRHPELRSQSPDRMATRKIELMTTDQLMAQFMDYATGARDIAMLPKMKVVEDELRRRGAYERLQTLLAEKKSNDTD